MMRRLLGVVASVGQFALWAVLLGFLLLVAIPRFTALDVLVVRGGSMEPTIHVGSVVIVNRDALSPAIGAITSFHDPEAGIVTHRIVAFDGSRYVTKGDANETEDVIHRTTADVHGTVVLSLPLAGYVIHALQQPFAFLVLLLGTGGLLVAGAIRTIAVEVGRLRERRRTTDAD